MYQQKGIEITSCGRTKLFRTLFLALSALIIASISSLAAKVDEFWVPFDETADGPELPSTLNPGHCGEDINWPLHLTGTAHWVVQIVEGADQTTISWKNMVKGTAVDALGNEFEFSYFNNLRGAFQNSPDVLIIGFDTDKFTMNGSAGHLHVGFVGTLLIYPDGNLEVVPKETHGDWICDPI